MTHQPRHHRNPQPNGMRLNRRDLQIIEAVYQHRVLSQYQIHRLLFTHQHPSVSQRILRRLFDHGYLQRRFLPAIGGIVTSPILYLLDERGSQVLLKAGGYEEVRWQNSDNKVGYEHLEHLLDINTFRVELALACQADPDLSLLLWMDDTTLKATYDRVSIPSMAEPIALIPDGFFILKAPVGETYYFIEMDRGTMALKRFRQKIEAYLAYIHSDPLAQRFRIKTFRLLTLTETPLRLQNLKKVTEDLQGENLFWFGLLPDLTADALLRHPVWQIAQREGHHSLWK